MPCFELITIVEQRSFAAVGEVIRTPGEYDKDAPSSAGQTLHGDHLYAFYQVARDTNPRIDILAWRISVRAKLGNHI